MKIYTKTGDKGTTSLVGGERVPKNHIRLDACGTVDELISYIGLLRDHPVDAGLKKFLVNVQGKLMIIASQFAAGSKKAKKGTPEIIEDDVIILEKEIDRLEEKLKPLKSFILPGGNIIVSVCHISRAVCRRAEREAFKLSLESKVDELALKYLNRLSDFLFVLSRKLSSDFNAEEIPWIKIL
jgi:cob(I)alamin adenosyltransferase